MATVAAMAWARSVGVRRSRTPLRKVLSQISMGVFAVGAVGQGGGAGDEVDGLDGEAGGFEEAAVGGGGGVEGGGVGFGVDAVGGEGGLERGADGGDVGEAAHLGYEAAVGFEGSVDGG